MLSHRPLLPIAALTVSLAGCPSRPPFVVLTFEAAGGATAGFAELVVGETRDGLRPVTLRATELPLNIAVTASSAGLRTLWAEIRAADGTPLARGTTRARLARTGTPTARMVLWPACDDDGDCNDGTFCAGTSRCQDGMCAVVGTPCQSVFACVQMRCVELGSGTGTCDVTVDHLACAPDEYCNPAAGCIPGAGCQTDADCQDAFTCNGAERCVNFVCVAGAPPPVDDGDICTLDGCNDARTADGLTPVFHAPQPALDGVACAVLGTGAAGICVASKGGCALSECGDGVVDGAAGEACDDGAANSAAWALDPRCLPGCTGLAPFCGDNQVDPPHESCDDGARYDSGNGCSNLCQRNDGGCGDAQTQSLFEECDDANGDDCDGCRGDCRLGCVCGAPGACLGAAWCDDGVCVPCVVALACGPACVTCGGATPVCAGLTDGCVCDPSPALGPRGSCPPTTFCGPSGACEPCGDALHCGQECLACAGDTPVCGGAEVGCVADPASDPPSRGCTGLPDFVRCQLAAPTRSYNICIDGQCVEPGCGDASCSPKAPRWTLADVLAGWELPDTGQRVCSDFSAPITCTAFPCTTDGSPTYCGQDAQYGWDATHADPTLRWQRSAGTEPVVVDLLTDLHWQGCVGGRYGGACENGGVNTNTQANVLTYCDQLAWGGFADWRLPDVYELLSLVTLTTAPTIDASLFPATSTAEHWTSTAHPTNAAWAYTIPFQSGELSYMGVGAAAAARCVRGGWTAHGGLPRFSRSEPVAGQAVVLDRRSALTWQGCLAGEVASLGSCTGLPTSLHWQASLAHCEGLSWAGTSDWRLPNRVELFTLVDFSRAQPAIDADAFHYGGLGGKHWTSSSTGNGANAWPVDFELGTSGFQGKGYTYLVRCVRGGP